MRLGCMQAQDRAGQLSYSVRVHKRCLGCCSKAARRYNSAMTVRHDAVATLRLNEALPEKVVLPTAGSVWQISNRLAADCRLAGVAHSAIMARP